MPRSHLTLVKPKQLVLKNLAFTPSALSSLEQLANDVAWFKSGGFKPQAPTHWYLDTRHECKTFESVASALVIGCFYS